ncbi:MAG: triple tyrosine motif-containing protein [Saprospiraceae bacterium]
MAAFMLFGIIPSTGDGIIRKRMVLVSALDWLGQKRNRPSVLQSSPYAGAGAVKQHCYIQNKYFKKLILSHLLGSILILTFLPFATAQQLQVGKYNFYSDFSKGLIKAVVTDSIGFVWVATDEGLIRFDGSNRSFYKDALPGGFAKGFLKRRNKPLLVVHDYGVTEIISRPDTTYFRKLIAGATVDSQDKLFFPKSLYEDKKQRLWIGEIQSIARLENGKIKKYRFREGTNTGSIYSIYRSFSFVEDAAGHLWVMSFNGELYYFDEAKDIFVECPLDIALTNVSSVIKIDGNTCWVGAQNGLFEVELAYPKVKSWRKLTGPTNISCAIAIDNEFYAGTWSGGLFKAIVQKNPVFSKIASLPFNDILSLAYDVHNGLWVAGSENVVSLTTGFFKPIPLLQADLAIETIGVLPDSTVVVGSWQNFYLLKRNHEDLKVTYTTLPISLAPTALYCDTTRLWIGTLDGSVFYYDLPQQTLHRVEKIIPSSNPISKIIKDKTGNIWIIGNKRYGLIRLDKDLQIHTYRNEGSAQSQTIYESSSGILFLGGSDPNHYLYCYFPSKDDFYDLSLPLDFEIKENFQVTDITTAKDGSFLLATSHGLLQYAFGGTDKSKNLVKRLNLEKVPIDEPIKAVALSEDGVMWVSTTSGLLAYDEASVLLYDQSSGLPSNILTNKGLLFDFDDNLWVGTSRGLAIFQRNRQQDSRTPVPVFTAFRLNGVAQLLDAEQLLKIPAKTNLEFNYLSLSFPAERLQYQTRLIGTDTAEWSVPSSQTSLLLSALPPGKYTLQVRAQQQGGFLWSQPSAISFVIARAWYQQWWAILLFMLTFMLVVTIAVRVYNWQLLQQKKRLEEIVAQRTEEIKRQDQQIIEQNERYRILKEKQLQDQIEYKNKQLMIYTLHLIQKNESLKELQLEMNKALRHGDRKDKAELRQFIAMIDYSFRKDDEWEKFKLYFENVYPGFFEGLMEKHPSLTPQELRLSALIRLNLSTPEIANVLGISAESVKTSRFRLKKKMELVNEESLTDHVMRF